MAPWMISHQVVAISATRMQTRLMPHSPATTSYWQPVATTWAFQTLLMPPTHVAATAFSLPPWEFQSGRDADGHGSHTASTAGGNNGVPAYIDGEYQGDISGVAPRARLATYKVCWTGNPDTGTNDGCASSDSAAAIDQAVADGVDVINFSIGGSSNYFAAPDDVAFLFAADAGVFVATSNGNSGPGAGTVGTPSGVPWITAVGATQDDGVFAPKVTVNAPGSIAGVYNAIEGVGDVSLADTGPITDNVTLASTVTACNGDGPNRSNFRNNRPGCTWCLFLQ